MPNFKIQPKTFLFKQQVRNKVIEIFARILILNSALLQSDLEILYAANTILTHLSFFL